MPELIIFDVDKTLARSKRPVDGAMATLLAQLLARTKVAIVSGDSFSVLETNVAAQLPQDAALENFFILPTSGAALYEWKEGKWIRVYEERVPESEVPKIEAAVRDACAQTQLVDFTAQSFGERIEYRGGQITLSALGQDAPIEEKERWDPGGDKKKALRDAIAAKLPDYDVKVGGSTSIDITKPGVNKAYGVRKLSEHLSIPISNMLYVGDALFPGGNDEVVKESGIRTRAVKDPEETATVIKELIG